MIESNPQNINETVKELGRMNYLSAFLYKYSLAKNREAVEDVLSIILRSVEKIEILLAEINVTNDEKPDIKKNSSASMVNLLVKISQLNQLKTYIKNSSISKKKDIMTEELNKVLPLLFDLRENINNILLK